jgi:hypothetical protein
MWAADFQIVLDEMLVGQHAVPDGQTTPPVEEGAKQTQSLSAFFLTWLT